MDNKKKLKNARMIGILIPAIMLLVPLFFMFLERPYFNASDHYIVLIIEGIFFTFIFYILGLMIYFISKILVSKILNAETLSYKFLNKRHIKDVVIKENMDFLFDYVAYSKSKIKTFLILYIPGFICFMISTITFFIVYFNTPSIFATFVILCFLLGFDSVIFFNFIPVKMIIPNDSEKAFNVLFSDDFFSDYNNNLILKNMLCNRSINDLDIIPSYNDNFEAINTRILYILKSHYKAEAETEIKNMYLIKDSLSKKQRMDVIVQYLTYLIINNKDEAKKVFSSLTKNEKTIIKERMEVAYMVCYYLYSKNVLCNEIRKDKIIKCINKEQFGFREYYQSMIN